MPAPQGWQDWPRGLAVLAGIIWQDLRRGRPAPLSTAARLAMLPCRGLPVSAPVSIRWSSHQIPCIEAQTDRDLAVGLGAVHAHLRLGQIEIMRRLSQGRIAEMVGPLGIEADRAIRLMQLDRAVPDMIAALPERTRAWAEGFIDGINHHLAHAASLPREFEILAIGREPWNLRDLMTLSRLSSADISWLVWSKLLRVRDRMGAADWASLWPRLLGDAAAPVSLDGIGAAARAAAAMARSGSNSAAVSGAMTASGAALIASDPHLPYGMPNPWLIAGLRSPAYHCVGMMMPGLPFLALGRNPSAAWGGTSLHAQSSDLFDISGLPEADIEERIETIGVRGAAPRPLRLHATEFGPVVSEGLMLPSRRRQAMRWMGHRPSDELSAMLAVARCRDWRGFTAALRGFGVSGLNMVFAGRNGEAGHLLAAHLPQRPMTPPADLHLPVAAAAAWDATVDASALPMRASPDHDLVVSANQRPEGCAVPAGYFFSPPDRAARIEALLRSADPAGIEDAALAQSDVHARRSLALRDLLQEPIGKKRRRPHQERFLSVLAGWDGSYGAASEGALAFELLLGGVVQRLARAGLLPGYAAVWMTQPLLWDDLHATPKHQRAWAVARALVPAARRLERHGNWGGFHRMVLKHPLGRLPVIGSRYRARAFAGEGSADTVHKSVHPIGTRRHHASFGACARHVSDLSNLDANLFVLLGGQDGWFGSANFEDMTGLWQSGLYVRVPLSKAEIRRLHPYETMLEPG